jgi:nucleotide-binding universal stress UspA family protein
MYRLLIPVDENEERTEAQTDHVTSRPLVEEDVEALVLHVKEADHKGAPEMDFEEVPGATTAVEEIEAAGITCQTEQRGGPPAKNIMEAVADFEPDEIVMGGRKRSGVVEIVLGSVTRDIVQAADCAVTVVG